MDVDGTMTDGGVTLLSQTDGTALEIKTFDAHDGQGLTLAHTAGLRTGCITGRESAALLRRAQEMKMEFICMKQPLKMPAYEEILRKAGVAGFCGCLYRRRSARHSLAAPSRPRDRRGQCRPRSQTGRALHYQSPSRPWSGARGGRAHSPVEGDMGGDDRQGPCINAASADFTRS